MEISNLTFIVTDDCNFNCSYCLQKKEKKFIDNASIETAVNFFYPFLTCDDKNYISFYGGEPLLAFDKIKKTTLLVQEKNKTDNRNIEFNVTTNGTLLTEEMLDFFNHHKYGILLSFDGLAQDKGRKKGTLEQMVRLIEDIQGYPGIDLEINSVFTPKTISTLTESLRFMIESWQPEITINIATTEEWKTADIVSLKEELKRLTDFLVLFYKKNRKVPVKNFQAFVPGKTKTKEKGDKKNQVFRCNAGKGRMAITPGGEVWGCYLFHDYFKTQENHSQYRDYYFGLLTDFIANVETRYQEILNNYSELRMDYLQVDKGQGKENDYCFLCEDINGCVVCPVNAAYTSGTLGIISARKCELIKTQKNAQQDFRQQLLQFN